MPSLSDLLPRTTEVIETGMAARLHLGAIIHITIDDKVLVDDAIGEARAGVPLRPEQMLTWWSMTKPSVAVAIGRLWEAGALELDDPVARFVPEFAAGGKESITIRHCLTHTGGFRGAERVRNRSQDPDVWWDETTAAISATPIDTDWVPGHRAGYHASASMHMLAEVVRRIDGRRFSEYVREEVFLPLGMPDCWVGMPREAVEAYGERLGTMHRTEADPQPLDRLDRPENLARCFPGGGGRGPMAQLVRLYRMLLNEGELDGVRILSPQAVAAMTARHRVGLRDETFGVVIDWGLGFTIDSGAMGPYCSRRAFGHGGMRSSQAMADPEHQLAVAVQFNGMCATEPHYRRLRDTYRAIYLDLGLADESDPGRDKPLPTKGVATA